jgi:hypothetical protein
MEKREKLVVGSIASGLSVGRDDGIALSSRADVPGKEHGLCPVLRAATGCPSRLIAAQRDIVRGGT